MMKKQKSTLFLGMAIFSLFLLLIIFLKGNKSTGRIIQEEINVLGESTNLLPNITFEKAVTEFFQDAFDQTKEVITENLNEVKKNILTSIQKEITNLTESQIQTIKREICTEWGYYSPLQSPTPSPSPTPIL